MISLLFINLIMDLLAAAVLISLNIFTLNMTADGEDLQMIMILIFNYFMFINFNTMAINVVFALLAIILFLFTYYFDLFTIRYDA